MVMFNSKLLNYQRVCCRMSEHIKLFHTEFTRRFQRDFPRLELASETWDSTEPVRNVIHGLSLIIGP